jgi:hypothetical protein
MRHYVAISDGREFKNYILGGLYWHNVYTKFRQNRSPGISVEMVEEGHTTWQLLVCSRKTSMLLKCVQDIAYKFTYTLE